MSLEVFENGNRRHVFTTLDKIKGRLIFGPESGPMEVKDVIICLVGNERVSAEHPNPGIPHVGYSSEVHPSGMVKCVY